MLETIPIYRMTLKPESYLLEFNKGKMIVDIICDLPNTQNEYRKKELLLRPLEHYETYYNGRLLLETKKFCREMLYRCSINVDGYESILRGNNIEKIFAIIEKFRIAFFKNLILKDIDHYKLLEVTCRKSLKQVLT
ncbi:MAG TPA: hypothetical protein VHB70_12600 [Parafilimonas sp.]|nr:hypothetical protein [Parafilimonas sp.]